mmetsp:Transcript_6542/g.12942  ORF Transcript_6542/g.12942 Transcript_6542/m.12942 type:complete len:102 (-) Transcript_6542:57-362(-)
MLQQRNAQEEEAELELAAWPGSAGGNAIIHLRIHRVHAMTLRLAMHLFEPDAAHVLDVVPSGSQKLHTMRAATSRKVSNDGYGPGLRRQINKCCEPGDMHS